MDSPPKAVISPDLPDTPAPTKATSTLVNAAKPVPPPAQPAPIIKMPEVNLDKIAASYSEVGSDASKQRNTQITEQQQTNILLQGVLKALESNKQASIQGTYFTAPPKVVTPILDVTKGAV